MWANSIILSRITQMVTRVIAPVSFRVALELDAIPFSFSAKHWYTPASDSWVAVKRREALYKLCPTLVLYWSVWPSLNHVMFGKGEPSTMQVSEKSRSVRISASSGLVMMLGASEEERKGKAKGLEYLGCSWSSHSM